MSERFNPPNSGTSFDIKIPAIRNAPHTARLFSRFEFHGGMIPWHFMSKGLIKRVGGAERKYVEEVLATDFANSKNCGILARFEKAFAQKFDVKYAVAHTNGTATLHSALYAAGVRAGDEVITTPLTMSATCMSILQADAVPVFADVVEDTFQIDPRSIERIITPRTKAIMPVALYGLSPE